MATQKEQEVVEQVKQEIVVEKPMDKRFKENRAPETGRYDKRNKSFGDSGDRKNHRPMARRKVCQFCVDKVESIDYKDISRIRKFVTEKGKILPSRQTGTCAKHQRELTTAIKRARYMGLLHYKGD